MAITVTTAAAATTAADTVAADTVAVGTAATARAMQAALFACLLSLAPTLQESKHEFLEAFRSNDKGAQQAFAAKGPADPVAGQSVRRAGCDRRAWVGRLVPR